MSDKSLAPAPSPQQAAEHDEHGDMALALTALEDFALAHATACSILEQIDMMIGLADIGRVSPDSVALLRRARAEAERVLLDSARAIRPH